MLVLVERENRKVAIKDWEPRSFEGSRSKVKVIMTLFNLHARPDAPRQTYPVQTESCPRGETMQTYSDGERSPAPEA